MKIARPSSKLARYGIAILSLWVSGAIFLVLFNRYSHRADLDSLTDLVLISLAVPIAIILAGIFFWLVGRAASTIIIIFSFIMYLIFVAFPAYQKKQRSIHEKQRVAEIQNEVQNKLKKHEKDISRKAEERCAKYKQSSKKYAKIDYIICVSSEKSKIRENLEWKLKLDMGIWE